MDFIHGKMHGLHVHHPTRDKPCFKQTNKLPKVIQNKETNQTNGIVHRKSVFFVIIVALLFFFHLILITNNKKKEYEEPCADCVVSRKRERGLDRGGGMLCCRQIFCFFLARGPKKLNRHFHTTVENFGPHTRFAADCVFSLPHPFVFHPSTIHYHYVPPSRDCRCPMSFWVFDLVLGNDGMFDSLVVVFPCSKLGRIMMMILVTTWTS